MTEAVTRSVSIPVGVEVTTRARASAGAGGHGREALVEAARASGHAEQFPRTTTRPATGIDIRRPSRGEGPRYPPGTPRPLTHLPLSRHQGNFGYLTTITCRDWPFQYTRAPKAAATNRMGTIVLPLMIWAGTSRVSVVVPSDVSSTASSEPTGSFRVALGVVTTTVLVSATRTPRNRALER